MEFYPRRSRIEHREAGVLLFDIGGGDDRQEVRQSGNIRGPQNDAKRSI
jgi:hypothetical protein